MVKYYKKINGLRFIAIMLVLIEHFATFIGSKISAGFYGVDLFFVISGFLVTTTLIKPNLNSYAKNYFNFVGRRTLRIFPIYYFTLLILWLLNLEIVRTYIINLLTYTYNYAIVFYKIPVSPVSHFWSLSVEEQFYLFWPFLVLFLKQKLLLLLVLSFIIITLSYTQLIFGIFTSLNKYNYYGLLSRVGSLCLGASGAILYKLNALPKKILENKIVEVCVLIILIASLLLSYKIRLLVLGLCSLYLVLKASFFDFNINVINKFLNNSSVVYIGTISYGIYIYHLPIDFYFTKYIFSPFWDSINFDNFGVLTKLKWHSWIFKFPLYSILSIIVAAFSFKYIEKPILNLKRKFV